MKRQPALLLTALTVLPAYSASVTASTLALGSGVGMLHDADRQKTDFFPSREGRIKLIKPDSVDLNQPNTGAVL